MATDIEKSTVTVNGLNAYLARPSGGSTSGMLLLPMITGIGAQVREYAENLAGEGITALSWDPWQGRPSADETPFDVLARWMTELEDETCLAEQHQLLDHLFGELGCTQVGTIGWCLGGRYTLLLGARESRLANVVAYHPTVPGTPAPNHTVDAVAATAAITAPTMMLCPGSDDLVPAESYRRLQQALQSRDSGVSIVHLYPGAEHGFSAKGRHGNPVNKAAFEVSWPQVIAFIKTTTQG
ncbi:MAG TPA: dienelactone hydrolase family protein [Pseudonocardiaceae bacterium]|jgi:carboxymethylenebutenolidase|nr:dienelactone hydrolase family protein [Pseudonocardiaceae bacterium]